MLIYTHQKEGIGFVIFTKIVLIVMVLYVQGNYLNLLEKETDIVYIRNIKYKRMIAFVKVIVFLYNLFDKKW